MIKKIKPSRWRPFWAHHRECASDSVQALLKYPFSSLMTLAVLAIAFCLPLGLWVAVKNAQNLAQFWDNGVQLSVFLDKQIPTEQREQLVVHLKSSPEISQVDYLSPDKALEELRQLAGLTGATPELPDNPLPGVIVVKPQPNISHHALNQLALDLQAKAGVDFVQTDLEWVKRLHAILSTSQHIVWVLALSLGFSILIIVGNTIRMLIYERKSEIEIMKLYGATDRYARRPFLYSGSCLGFLAGVLAWFITTAVMLYVSHSFKTLMMTYNMDYSLQGVPFDVAMLVIALASFLGLLGAWVSTKVYLAKIHL